jgi:hypothetical protein
MRKVIFAAAVLALGLGLPPVLAASHSGGSSGHSSGHGTGQGKGHRTSATREPEGVGIFGIDSDTDTPICPQNPHTLACPQ